MAITLFGPAYSTYTRSARLGLEEKGAAYDLVEVDIMTGQHLQPDHLGRNPFGPVPAFDHDGFALYETGAILRYVDEALPGPALQPREPKARARMNQVMSIIDSYAYGAIILKLFWQRAIVPMQGGEPDARVIEEAMPRARLSLDELTRLRGENKFLVGSELSLADLLLAPVIAYLSLTPEGQELMAGRPGLAQWWQTMQARPSVQKTQPSLG